MDKSYDILEATRDMEVYEQLTDNVFDRIRYYEDPNNSNMNRAKELLRRIDERRLYKFVGEIRGSIVDTDLLIEEILRKSEIGIEKENIVTDDLKIDYGKGQDNPINFLFFYKKSSPDRGVKICREEVSNLLPVSYCDRKLRVYYRENDRAIINELSRAIDELKRNGLPRV